MVLAPRRVYAPIQLILLVIWIATGAHFPWFAFPLLGWGIILAVHGVYAFVMKTPEEIMIERSVGSLGSAPLSAGGRNHGIE